MKFLILLLILGIGLYLVFKKKDKSSLKARKKDLSLPNVGVGGVVSLMNVGWDKASFDMSIEAKHTYQSGGYYWYELEGNDGRGKVWLEYEEDDELIVTLTLDKLNANQVPVTWDDVKAMKKKGKGSLTYDGRKYYFEEAGKANFYRNGDKNQPETYQYVDFESEDQMYNFSIEKWESGGIEAYVSQYLNPSQINIFSNEGDTDNE
ncbi:DUF4178 domain-containing protein [Spirochaeta cellobiosiphila]|uniref:DUF4178 domain-containing protein n=1 Tax=Spirochaeta cellobiosiphila TaxID=504483 RepID=UPI00040BC524|nr:DUF4178 domain-containing protein [Spirochaeta cellobiosiphila]